MSSFLFYILLLPLLCGVTNVLCGRLLPRRVAEVLAVAGVGGAALLTLLCWSLAGGEGTRVTLYSWAATSGIDLPVALLFDRLSAPMTLMVTSVATLIHLYAIGYMREEPDYARFFALLNLFVFAMLCIVLAENLLVLFLGWEGVGFCSYALIGYWYGEEKNADAGRKAFLVTRVGDVFLGIAVLWLFSLTGTLSISAINLSATGLPLGTVTALSLLLLLGACGKSAQLPLMTWLPDAMAGPTPVSALIHAATMVTAGVYLLCRLFPLISLSPTALVVIACIGGLTALYAATCALAQHEIKRVLAYSTMSQIGYMFLAIGAGSVSAAIFHLFTHAFFKAALFMGAGCVIHLVAGENDIRKMGGLAKSHPWLFRLFLIASLCLAGAPLTGGFFSKDAILAALGAHPEPLYRLLLLIALVTALLTSLYTFRLLYLVFAGESRSHHQPHHLPSLMLWTVAPLALLGLFGGLLNLPALVGGSAALHGWLGPLASGEPEPSHALEALLAGLSAALFAAGWWLARKRWAAPRTTTSHLDDFLRHGWQADALVDRVILRPFRRLSRFSQYTIDLTLIEGTLGLLAHLAQTSGEFLRRLVTGRVSHYLTAFAWGLVAVVGWVLLATWG